VPYLEIQWPEHVPPPSFPQQIGLPPWRLIHSDSHSQFTGRIEMERVSTPDDPWPAGDPLTTVRPVRRNVRRRWWSIGQLSLRSRSARCSNAHQHPPTHRVGQGSTDSRQISQIYGATRPSVHVRWPHEASDLITRAQSQSIATCTMRRLQLGLSSIRSLGSAEPRSS